MRRREVLGFAAATLVTPSALLQLGFVEGRNLRIIDHYSSAVPDARRENIRRLIQARPDAILSFGSSTTREVHAVAGGIPVVFTVVGDAVAYGLVKDLARPGRNLTGVTSLQREMTIKLLELLREVLPRAKRVMFAGDLKDVTYMPASHSIATSLRGSASSCSPRTPLD